jgi:hypothetical protein
MDSDNRNALLPFTVSGNLASSLTTLTKERKDNSMAEKPAGPKKLSDKNTKQEMIEAYEALSKQLQEKRASEINPEKRQEERVVEEAVKTATTLVPENIDREIGGLKADIGKMLGEIAEKLSVESAKFRQLQKAVESKQRELEELYGIEKTAVTLAALIETQNQKKRDFEEEMAREREEAAQEINSTRSEWEKEQKIREAELKERDVADKKTRDREKEAFDYAFKRDQQAMRDKFNDEKATLEKEIARKKEAAERELAEREKNIAAREKELAELRTRAAAFPKELETTVEKAVKDSVDRIKLEAKNREDLLRKEFEGERNVLSTKIESLDKVLKDVSAQNAKLSQQAEAAYQKVQEIAEKSIEGASHAKSFAELQKLFSEQNRKVAGEKS